PGEGMCTKPCTTPSCWKKWLRSRRARSPSIPPWGLWTGICWTATTCGSTGRAPITDSGESESRGTGGAVGGGCPDFRGKLEYLKKFAEESQMSRKYAIGIDFGTQSGRAVLVDLSDGSEVADHVTPYPHGVIDEALPESGTKLGHEWALQHPGDYLEVLRRSVPEVLRQSGVNPADVIGVGIDFTACTMLPVD